MNTAAVVRLLDHKDAVEILDRARQAVSSQAALRGSEALDLIKRVHARWRSQADWPRRAQALLDGPLASNDPASVSDIEGCLDPQMWAAKLRAELAHPRALDAAFEGTTTDAILSYQPRGVLLHISPGNSFLGGIDSLLHGIVTGNANVVKVSRSTPAVIAVLVELLQACGLPPGQAQLVTWDAGDSGLEGFFKTSVDAIVVWGSEAAVASFRAGRGPGVDLIEYGPKLSLSIMTPQGLVDPALVSRMIADVCRFEQSSCSSTQALLLQVPKGSSAASCKVQLFSALKTAFTDYTRGSPPRGKTKHDQIEVLKALERAKLRKAQGADEDFLSGYPDWLVVWKGQGSKIEPSPLWRTLLVYPYSDETGLADLLTPVRHYLQTVSLACADDQVMALTERLWALGVNRVVEAGRSTEYTVGAPHDGGHILSRFCRVASLESARRRQQLWFNGSRDSILGRIQRIVRAAAAAPFYARRFEAAGLPGGRLRDMAEFESLPWLSKEDIFQFGPPASSDLLTMPFEKAGGAYLFTTGGSTGAPKYALYSREEWDEVSDLFCKGFQTCGITPSDRMANLYVGGGLWSAFIATTEGIEKLGCLNLPVGGSMEPEQALELFKTLGVTAVFGLPSTLLRLASCAETHPGLAVPLRTILYGGERMTDAMTAHVSRIFGGARVRSGSYAAVDAGCIGYQCAHAPGTIHHVLENYCYLEICDEKTGQPVEPGEEGEIVVTNLSRRLSPVIRLRSGDRGRQLTNPCGCGNPALTFEILGRSDDMVRVGGANVFLSDVEKLCTRFPSELSMIYQVRLFKCGVDDAYELKIEGNRDLTPEQADRLTESIRTDYLSIARELREYIEDGFLKHFEITLCRPGGIECNPKTRKIVRVIDERLA
jgi:phenylacetate-coenzyme A ligase PaaK-like adenylate-forming protein